MEPDDRIETSQIPEGVAAEPASQDAALGEQSSEQGQQGSSVAVDNGESNASSEVDTRPRPSQFVAGRREIRRLENEISQMRQAFQAFQQQNTASTPRAPALDPNEFYKNPLEFINKVMEERDAKIKGEIPGTFAELERKQGLQRNLQEAERMIVTNEAVKRDPQGVDRIKDILYDDEYGLNEMSKAFPVQAARLALQLYNQKYASSVTRRSSANAPNKAQMQSTATTVNGAGQRPNIGDEYLKLRNELMANPMLAQDPAFVEKLNALKTKRQLGSNQ